MTKMPKINLLLILALCESCNAFLNRTVGSDNPRAIYPSIPAEHNVFYFFVIVMLATIIRIVLIRYDIPTPYGAFMIMVGVIWGIICNHNLFVLLASDAMNTNPVDLVCVYLPALVFSTSFSLDVPIFLKTIPQLLVIGIFVTFLTGTLFGVLMRLVIEPSWSIKVGLTFGIFIVPINPASIVYLLKQQTTATRHISALLEGEAIFNMLLAEMTHDLIINFAKGFVVHWYQFVMVLIRFILFGIAFGYFVGLLGRYMMRTLYRYPLTIFMISFGFPFFTFFLSDIYISGCGSISVMILGTMMAMERSVLAKETNQFLTDMWETIGYSLDAVMCVTITLLATVEVATIVTTSAYIRIIVTYLTYYSIRFICFLLFAPIISRLGYGMDLKCMIVCVWSGLKSPFSLALSLIFVEDAISAEKMKRIFFQCVGIYFLSVLINGTFTRKILEFLGLREISMARKINMTNCMKHIFTKRNKTVAILKMDRFLADVNWPVVLEATDMKHPYRMGMEDTEEDNFFLLGYRFTVCPDCKSEIPKEPTTRELKDMAKEAKMRVLKSKKMCYARQYENGMMTKEGIKILSQAVELAMDTEAAVIQLEGLEKRFKEENCIYRCIRKKVKHLNRSQADSIRPPRKYFRRLCYRICINNTFEHFMLVIITIHCVFITVSTIYHPPIDHLDTIDKKLDVAISVLDLIFSIIYIVEVILKIMAFSWIHFWEHGVKTYFKSVWRNIDFLVVVTCILQGYYDLKCFYAQIPESKYGVFYRVLTCLRLLRVVRLFTVLKIFYPKFVTYLDRSVDSQLAFTYELGKSYAIGETEILDMLPYMIDNTAIREEIKQKIERDKVIITKLLGMVQKEKPWIAITVKTKQAIRTILNSMKEAANQLRTAGWVDDYEQEKLFQVMGELWSKVNSIKSVQPSAPKVIFKEVAWMAGDQAVIDFLFENVTVKKFEPGDVVFEEGTVADGIYIVVTGLFMIIYKPESNVLTSLHEYGQLPIADYLSATQYEERVVDYIVSGNCIGELSTLTGRAYNCTVSADAHCQVYVLSKGVIKRAMELNPDPVIGLECRLWKEVSIRMAVPLLMSVPAYQGFSQDQIKYALERAFVPNLSNYKIFAVTDMIEDIILIEGCAADFNTRESFVAPCCIPRTVQKLILPKSSLINIPVLLETKLLIIPEKDVDEYDVMILAEDMCELVDTGASMKCLQHATQEKTRKKKVKMMAARKKGTAVSKTLSKLQPDSNDSVGMLFFKRTDSETNSINMEEEEENKRNAEQTKQSKTNP
ncbi:solute carrier family 9 member C1-like [Tribolium castaneum]|uniref:solute carrier family 9 member C1-like n=1 Tax=Tribolium castaneum TaxID=7070 RepID=UPI00077DDF5D|nr:PREDICTED: sodium/hydrogen exchanger 10-like [Tribolium castaneum]|eukprot:XP_008199714.2 PREDICTED: sodium/hydrogen exchanger 10-like [Tribolium castaneum]